MKGGAREWMRTVLFMMAVTFAVTAPLSAIQLLTANRVARNQKLFIQRAVLAAAGVEAPKGDREALALYGERVEAGPSGVYRVKGAEGAVRTDVYVRSGPGLWGRITAAVGVDREAKTVTGVAFIEQVETPGLGARIEEPWFKRQFVGRVGPFKRVPEGQKDLAGNEIHAVTGATITTVAVQEIIEKALAEAKESAPAGGAPAAAGGGA